MIYEFVSLWLCRFEAQQVTLETVKIKATRSSRNVRWQTNNAESEAAEADEVPPLNTPSVPHSSRRTDISESLFYDKSESESFLRLRERTLNSAFGSSKRLNSAFGSSKRLQ